MDWRLDRCSGATESPWVTPARRSAHGSRTSPKGSADPPPAGATDLRGSRGVARFCHYSSGVIVPGGSMRGARHGAVVSDNAVGR